MRSNALPPSHRTGKTQIIHKLASFIISWLYNHKLNDKRYAWANPRVSGNMEHFLPFPMWTEEMEIRLIYHVKEWQWDGLKWQWKGVLSLDDEEVRKLRIEG